MAITRHSPCCDPGSIPGIGVNFYLIHAFIFTSMKMLFNFFEKLSKQ